jgi:Dihydrodipicolinate synthase/N-acetylneuraminate lyase
MRNIPQGVFPTMITPYTEQGVIDFEAVSRMVDWYAAQGVQGLFAVCQSSEMFYLNEDERVALAAHVVESARGRMCVVASGHVSDAPEDQLRELTRMAQTGIDALVLVSNRFADETQGDDVLIERMESLISRLPAIPLGIYECPHPYKRLLSKKVLRYMVQSGRFAFLKDTCCDAECIRNRLALLDGSIQLYNANTATLLPSLRAGGSGFSGIMGNIHPQLYVWLCENFATQMEKAAHLAAFLTLASGIERGTYPDCAKYHLQQCGIPMQTFSRNTPKGKFNILQKIEMDALRLLENAFISEYLS